jgi:hypothetical protein
MKATFVVLALAIPAQERTPEQTFNAIEEKYATAPAYAMVVRVISEITVNENKPVASTMEGEYLKKTGKKMRLGLWGKLDGDDQTINLAANGEHMAVALTGMAQIQQKKVPDNLDADMATALVRPGLFGSIYLSMGVTSGSGRDGKPADLKSMFTVSEIKAGADEKVEVRSGKTLADRLEIECKSITYRLKVGETDKVCEGQLWYDKNLRVIKRTLKQSGVVKEKKVSSVVTEIYENITMFDEAAKIPDTEFKLPTDK